MRDLLDDATVQVGLLMIGILGVPVDRIVRAIAAVDGKMVCPTCRQFIPLSSAYCCYCATAITTAAVAEYLRPACTDGTRRL